MLLDVIVAGHGQAFAAIGAAAGQHLAAAFGRHARPKAMHSHAAALLGLIRSLRHLS